MKKKSPNYSAELRERAVRMVEEHREEHGSERASIQSVAAKLGCSLETLRRWVRESQRGYWSCPDHKDE